jgi:hypothetical protein
MRVEIVVERAVQVQGCEPARFWSIDATTQLVGRLTPDRQRKLHRRELEILLPESRHEDDEIADHDQGSKDHFHVPNGTTIDRRQFLRFNYSIFDLLSNRGAGLLHPARR